MEREELLLSSWNIPENGAARRKYHITEEGVKYLKNARDKLKRSNEIIMILLGDKP
jgi:DNA-binding PadR family transcriptional regulator